MARLGHFLYFNRILNTCLFLHNEWNEFSVYLARVERGMIYIR